MMNVGIGRAIRSINRGVISSSFSEANSSPLQKLLDHRFARLCRYDKPIGCMLLYWPTTWGLAIGAATVPSIPILAMFLMGAWTSRSAGCVINDYLDRDFDRSVERCKTRPLASGEVSVKQAFGVMMANLCGGLYVLTQLPIPALVATFAILPVAALYPLAKRYTKYPQLVLGLAFNSGVVIGALTLNPFNLNWPLTMAVYGAGISWTLVYDTVYAYQDIADDKKLGLLSTAITWEEEPKKYLKRMTAISFVLLSSTALIDSTYIYCLPAFAGTYAYLFSLIDKIDLSNRAECGKFFQRNNYIGGIIFLSLIVRGLLSTDKDKQPK